VRRLGGNRRPGQCRQLGDLMLWPHYDAIRDEPAFAELLAEIS